VEELGPDEVWPDVSAWKVPKITYVEIKHSLSDYYWVHLRTDPYSGLFPRTRDSDGRLIECTLD